MVFAVEPVVEVVVASADGIVVLSAVFEVAAIPELLGTLVSHPDKKITNDARMIVRPISVLVRNFMRFANPIINSIEPYFF